jgi:hypothetical protein
MSILSNIQLYHYNDQQLKWIDVDKGIPDGWEPVPMGTLNIDINPLKVPRNIWESRIEFD